MAATRLIPTRDYYESRAQRPERNFDAEIERLDRAITQVAESGDLGKVRELRGLRKQIEMEKWAQDEARLRPIVEAGEERKRRQPAPGERGRLVKERSSLLAKAGKKEKEKAALLGKIAEGDDGLLERAEQVEANLEIARASIAGIDQRLEQIRGWEEDRQGARALQREQAAERRDAAERAKIEKALKAGRHSRLAIINKKLVDVQFGDEAADGSRSVRFTEETEGFWKSTTRRKK